MEPIASSRGWKRMSIISAKFTKQRGLPFPLKTRPTSRRDHLPEEKSSILKTQSHTPIPKGSPSRPNPSKYNTNSHLPDPEGITRNQPWVQPMVKEQYNHPASGLNLNMEPIASSKGWKRMSIISAKFTKQLGLPFP